METQVKTSQEMAADTVVTYIVRILKPNGKPGSGIGYESAANMLVKSHKDQARVLKEWRVKRIQYRKLSLWRRFLVKFLTNGIVEKDNF